MLTRLPPNRRQAIVNALIKAVLIVVMAVCLLASYHRLRAYQSSLPRGCDPFGYLYQAEAVRDGNLLGEQTSRPWLDPLVESLASVCTYESDYMWMVAPHAHHYLSGPGKVVNQYPPGTALVLAPFPKELRSLAYPVVVTASLALLVAFSWRKNGWGLAASGFGVAAIASGFLVLQPFEDQYRLVGSVAMTFAPLIAAGWLMRKHPLAGLAFAAFTVLFRISNIWVLPVLALPYVFAEFFEGQPWPGWRSFALRCVKGACVCFVCGPAWILLYQWLLLGNPLHFTYSPIDQEGAKLSDMLKNAAYYFNPALRNWLLPHIAALAVALFVIPKGRRHWLLLAFVIMAWNYLFYLTHKVTTPYYTYASAPILIGLCLAFIGEFTGWKSKTAAVLFAVISLVSLHSAFKDAVTPATSIAVEERQFTGAFAGADVVWAEFSTGTIEYATGIPSMRINWGTETAVTTALSWLHDHGYTQAIMLDDDSLQIERTLAFLAKTGLAWETREDANLKRVLWILPEKKAEEK